MRRSSPAFAAVLLALLASPPAHAQSSGHDHSATGHDAAATAAFIEAAREATRRYHDRAAAIADGFRLLGPDFPAMGEHWVQPGRMLEGRLDIARPQALSYAVIDGRPVLLGVIYAMPLRPEEPLPEFPLPGLPWHDHSGAIDEESVLLHHVPSRDGAPGVRLVMLHAWIWADNPEGAFTADNWALPFLRLGLKPSPQIRPDAARTLSLAAGGDVYYRLLLRALADPTPTEAEQAAALIAEAREHVARWLPTTERGAALDEAALAWLEERWAALWADIAKRLWPEAAARLRPLILPD